MVEATDMNPVDLNFSIYIDWIRLSNVEFEQKETTRG